MYYVCCMYIVYHASLYLCKNIFKFVDKSISALRICSETSVPTKMAHVSFPFKRTNKAAFKKPATALTQDNVYWKKLGSATLVKEYGAIDYLHFSPVEPHYFAATCSVRVQIYDPITKMVTKNISKFQQAAYGGTFRSDGRLLVAGSEDASVKIFDVSSKNLLRIFTGHTGPVHRTFFTKDQTKILSYSDDKTVTMWDIAVEQQISNYSEHTDYVRAGAPSPISPNLFMAGSYDHTVKLYDNREKEAVVTVNHGCPVESTLFLPSGGIFISAGGTEIKVWDIFNAGRLLACISQHHKTVTSLCLASNNGRLMSGSLDRHVKVYDIGTFRQVHNIDFPNAVLSMAISENDDVLAVGMIDGIISIRKRKEAATKQEQKGLYKFAPDNYRPRKHNNHKAFLKGPRADMVVREPKLALKESECETHLRKMEFTQALAAALRPVCLAKHPEITSGLLQELLRRKVLHIAYEDLEEKKIEILLKYFAKYLGETRFTTTIIDAANVFIDVFGNQIHTFNVDLMRLYRKFIKDLRDEIEVCKKVCELEGAISMLLAGAQISVDSTTDYDTIVPSMNAQKEIVIDV